MDDGLWEPEGGRLQAWLMRHSSMRVRSSAAGFSGMQLGLVVARYYVGELGNLRGLFTEYDVWLPWYQLTFRNLEARTSYQGANGGVQITLRPASGVPDMSDPQRGFDALMADDGDLVSVEYLGGKRPVITGCLNHIRGADQHAADWCTGADDGEVYALTYNTTRARINKEGQVEIDLDDSSGAHTRSVVVNVGGEQLLKVFQDPASGDVRIELGSGGSLQKAVLGQSLLDALNQATASGGSGIHHTHSYLAAPTGGVPTATSEPLQAVAGSVPPLPLVSVSPIPTSVLTDKVKVEG